MAHWVNKFAMQAWGPKFDPWNPCKGERRKLAPEWSSGLSTCVVTMYSLPYHYTQTITSLKCISQRLSYNFVLQCGVALICTPTRLPLKPGLGRVPELHLR